MRRASELDTAAERLEDLENDGSGMNVVEQALALTLGRKLESDRLERISFKDWSLRVREPKAGRLDYDRFPFQRELYSQETAAAREVAIKKATQLGVSAKLLRWVLYWADMRGVTALYVFPKLKQMYDFSDARVKAVILKSEYLQKRITGGSVQNKGLKQVGLGWVYFRGSESEDDLDSVDADVLALDEYDRLVPENIPVAEHRLSGSELALMRRVGVPSYTNYGISRLYAESDRRRWLVKCGHGHELPLTWPGSVDPDRCVRICSECHVDLSPAKIAAGRWAAEDPDAEVRGYHMPRLIVPGLRVEELVRHSTRTLDDDRKAFWNRDMAEAYTPKGGQLTPEEVAAAISVGEDLGASRDAGGYGGDELVTMGVDVASARALHVRVSRHLGDNARRKVALYVGEAVDFNELDELMRRFQVRMCAIDSMPERRLAMAFAERFAGRVYLVTYTGDGQDSVLKVNDGERHVKVRRTEAMDAAAAMIRSQRNALPELPDSYARQLEAPMRILETGADGRKKVRYISTDQDDFFHSETFDVVATEAWFVRQEVDESQREELWALEDRLEFERSALTEDQEGLEYRAGPEDGYEPGFGE